MKIVFNTFGAVISTITDDEPLRQGNVGNTITATFQGKNNLEYLATLNFKRADGKSIVNTPMQEVDDQPTDYTYKFGSDFFFAIAGATEVNVFLHNAYGDIVASGTIKFSIEQTTATPNKCITQDQYNNLLALIADKMPWITNVIILEADEELPLVGAKSTLYFKPTKVEGVYERYVWNAIVFKYVPLGDTTINLQEYQKLSEKGKADGYASLNATSKVPDKQLGRGEVNGVAPLNQYQKIDAKYLTGIKRQRIYGKYNNPTSFTDNETGQEAVKGDQYIYIDVQAKPYTEYEWVIDEFIQVSDKANLAKEVVYDHSDSGLQAIDVQSAIDEIVIDLGDRTFDDATWNIVFSSDTYAKKILKFNFVSGKTSGFEMIGRVLGWYDDIGSMLYLIGYGSDDNFASQVLQIEYDIDTYVCRRAFSDLFNSKVNVYPLIWTSLPDGVTDKKTFYQEVNKVFKTANNKIYMWNEPDKTPIKEFFDIWGKPTDFKATHVYITIESISNTSSRDSFMMTIHSSNYANMYCYVVNGYAGQLVGNGSGWISYNKLSNAIDSKELYDNQSKNLIDFTKITKGLSLPNTQNALWYTTDYIQVEEGKTYTFSGTSSKFSVVYTANKGESRYLQDNTITINKGEKYIRLNSLIDGYNKPMLNEGSTALPYQPYFVPIIKKSLLPQVKLNDTDFYENEKGKDIISHKVLSVDLVDTTFYIKSKNLVDLNDPDIAYGGFYGKAGTFIADKNYNQTGYIPVEGGRDYTSNCNWVFVNWYDENKNFILQTASPDFQAKGYITAPSNAKYSRWVCDISGQKNPNLNWDNFQVEQGREPTPYEPYGLYIDDKYLPPSAKQDSFLKDLKWASYGDSITDLNSWQPYVATALSLQTKNLGVSSSCVALVPKNEKAYPCFVNDNRIQGIKDYDPDIITILGGTNDAHLQVLLGGLDEFTKPLDQKNKETFYGAYSYLIENLLTWKPTLKIIIISGMTTLYATNDYKKYADASKLVADKYALPFIDLFNRSGVNKKTIGAYLLEDGIHPNDKGGRLIASMVIEKLKEHYLLIKNTQTGNFNLVEPNEIGQRVIELERDMAHYSNDIVNLNLDKAERKELKSYTRKLHYIGDIHDVELYNQLLAVDDIAKGSLFSVEIANDTPREALNKGFPKLTQGSIVYGWFTQDELGQPMNIITDHGMFKVIDGGTLTCSVIDGEDFDIEYRVASQHQFNISTPQLAHLIKGLRVWYQYEFQGKKRLQHQDIYFTDKGDADATSYISNGLNIVGFLADTIAIEFDMTTGVIALRSTGTMPQTFKLVDLKGLR